MTNRTKTVPAATPTTAPSRRQALTGLFGLAAAATAGLAVTPKAAPAAVAPIKIGEFDADLARLNELGIRRLSPAEHELENRCQAMLLPAFKEAVNALQAVQEQFEGANEDDAASEWREDVIGLAYTVEWMADLAECDADFAVTQAAELETERRQAQEEAAGAHHGCPVLRAAHALDRLAKALDDTFDAHEAAGAEDARLAEDVQLWGWTLAQVRAGFDNQSARRMTDVARKASLREMMKDMEARGELMPIGAGTV